MAVEAPDASLERVTRAAAPAYDVKKRLGAGGMGAVYLAEERAAQRPVVIKVVHADLAASPASRGDAADALDRLRDEATLLGQVRHPNVVALYVARVDATPPFLVMEWVEGTTLHTWRTSAPRSVEARLDVLAQVATGVAAAHRNGVVHRDLKPENVLVRSDADGTVAKVVDFGIGTTTGTTRVSLACPAGTAGSPPYMAPEQFQGVADPRCDVYALGVMLHELMSGALPFAATDFVGWYIAHATAPLPTLPEDCADPGTRAAVAPIIARALAKEPTARFSTAGELVEALALARRVRVGGRGAPETGPLVQVPPQVAFFVVVALRLELAPRGLDDLDDLEDLDDCHALAAEALQPVARAFDAVLVDRGRSGQLVFVLGARRRRAREPAAGLALAGVAVAAATEALGEGALVRGAVHVGDILVVGQGASGSGRLEGATLDDALDLCTMATSTELVVSRALLQALDAPPPSVEAPASGRGVPALRVPLSATQRPDRLSLLEYASSPFFGREEPLARLMAAVVATEREGTARVTWLTGQAGVGKTRLAVEAARRVRERWPSRPIVATRAPTGATTPYAALWALVAELAGLAELARPAVEREAHLAGYLREVLHSPLRVADALHALRPMLDRSHATTPGLGSAPTQRAETARPTTDFAYPTMPALEGLATLDRVESGALTAPVLAMLAVVEAEARRSRGLLWVIDGLELESGLDDTTVEALERVAALSAPVTVWVTSPSRPLPTVARAQTPDDGVALGPLAPDDAGTWIRALLGASTPSRPRLESDEGLVTQLVAWSGGVPLLIEEAVRRVLREPESVHALAPVAPADRSDARVRMWLERSLAALPTRPREVLEVAAAFGGLFSLAGLQAGADLPLEAVGRAVTELTVGGWLRSHHASCGDPEGCAHLGFTTPLAARLVEAGMLRSRREAVHRRLVAWLTERGNLEPARLAWHQERAGAPEVAFRAWIGAATWAARIGGSKAAASLVERAAACLTRATTAARRERSRPSRRDTSAAALELELLHARLFVDYVDGAFDRVMTSALAMAPAPGGDPEASESAARARLALLEAMAACKLGRIAEGLSAIGRGEALASLALASPADLWLGLWHVGAWLRILRGAPGDLTDAAERLVRALGTPEGQRLTALRGAGLRLLGVVHQRLGDLERATRVAEESLAVFETLGSPRDMAQTVVNLGALAALQARTDVAREHYQHARLLFDGLGDAEHLALCDHNLGDLAFQLGDLVRAERHLEAARAAVGRMRSGARWFLSETLHTLAMCRLEVGDAGAFDTLNAEALAESEASGRALESLRFRLAACGASARPEDVEPIVTAIRAAGGAMLAAYALGTFGLSLARRDGGGPLGLRTLRAAQAALGGSPALAGMVARWVTLVERA